MTNSHDNPGLWPILAATALFLCTWLAGAAFAASGPELRLYEDPNYGGHELRIVGPQATLEGSGLNNRISSIHVVSGRWVLCSRSEYRGDCLTFSRHVPNLRDYGFNNDVTSMYPVKTAGWSGAFGPAWEGMWNGVAYVSAPPPEGSIVLFEEKNFQGRWVVVNLGIDDMPEAGFIDQFSSVAVMPGSVWKMCSQPNYRSPCLYVADDIDDLAGIFDYRISSLERVY